jgi:hypothetical protein
MNWTRSRDAWIAEHCEGLQVEQFEHLHGQSDYGVKISHMAHRHQSEAYREIPHYNTDPAACIRAAEAWRTKGEGRAVKIEWDGPDVKAGLGDRVGGWHQWFSPSDRCAAALAWALYRATGGPA